MKIICIGRNYSAHAAEMNAAVPSEPVFFMKPDTALLNGSDFYYPDFTSDLHHEIELVLRISKSGKHIEQQFAHKYFEEIGLGIDFTARDIQEKCKKAGLPWEKGKSFDNSAVAGGFVNKKELPENHIGFSLLVNGQTRQQGDSDRMIFSFDEIISYVSKFITLRTGDLIYTGTPEGVGPVIKGDQLEGRLADKLAFTVRIK